MHGTPLCLSGLTCAFFMFFFFFTDTPTTEIYTLSLHDALPISYVRVVEARRRELLGDALAVVSQLGLLRSEEHTSELQSLTNLVCRLLLEKKKGRYRYVKREDGHLRYLCMNARM